MNRKYYEASDDTKLVILEKAFMTYAETAKQGVKNGKLLARLDDIAEMCEGLSDLARILRERTENVER